MNEVKGLAREERPAPIASLFDRALRVTAAELHARLVDAGFADQTRTQSRIFASIPPEGIRLTDLAERVWMTKQAAGELVDQIERAGYVERRPDPSDRRAKLICFTDRGWQAVDAALEIFDDIEARLRAQFGARRIGDVRRILESIAEQRADD